MPGSPIQFTCTSCGKRLKAPADRGGKLGRCNSCGEAHIVPTTGAASEGQLAAVPPVLDWLEDVRQSERSSPPKEESRDLSSHDGSERRTRPKRVAKPLKGEWKSGGAASVFVAALVLVGGLLIIFWCAGVFGSRRAAEIPETKPVSDEASEARAKLKIVLDSWALDKTQEDMTRNHPEIDINVVGIWRYKILKHEIVAENKTGPLDYEFAVIIVYQSEAGTEIKKNARFHVYKWSLDKLWHVTSLGG